MNHRVQYFQTTSTELYANSGSARFSCDSSRNRFIQLTKQDTSLTNQHQFSYPTRPPPPLLYTNKFTVYLFIPLFSH